MQFGQFNAQDGTIHGSHSNCVDCHDGSPGLGNVSSSNCIDCHPGPNPGECQLVNLHEGSLAYNPSGSSCFDCHSDCDDGGITTTTTTTGLPSLIKGTRWEVFVVGPFREGCTATTLTFREDNVITLDCLDGFGQYSSIGGAFSALFWSNNAYRGYNLWNVHKRCCIQFVYHHNWYSILWKYYYPCIVDRIYSIKKPGGDARFMIQTLQKIKYYETQGTFLKYFLL